MAKAAKVYFTTKHRSQLQRKRFFWLLIETQLAQIQRERHVIILGPWSVGTTTPLISTAGRQQQLNPSITSR